MRKLSWLALPFSVGIFLSVYLLSSVVVWEMGILAALVSVCCLWFTGKNRLRVLLAALGCATGFFWFGIYRAVWYSPALQVVDKAARFSAVVTQYPDDTSYGCAVKVHVTPENGRAFSALLYLDSQYETLSPGDTLTGSAQFRSAELVRDQQVTWYTAKGIFALGSSVQVASVSSPDQPPLRYAPQQLARRLQTSIRSLLQGENAELLAALVTGDRSGFSGAFSTALSRAGVAHVAAISGLHVVFLVNLILLLPGNRYRRGICAIPILVLFALMTGASPSTVRAVVMESVLLLAPPLGREADSITSLSFALMLILLENPYAAGSEALQLSFASLAGILTLTPRLARGVNAFQPTGKRLARLFVFVRDSLAMTLGATVFTLPLAVGYFDTLSLVAPLTNLMILWAVSLFFSIGFVAALVGLVWLPGGRVLMLACAPLGFYIRWAVYTLASWPLAATSGSGTYLRGWLALTYALLALVVASPDLRRRPLYPTSAVACILLISLALNRLSLSGTRLTARVLDVGQGQCVLFSSADESVAVDCGGNNLKSAGDTLADALQEQGRSTLDLLVLTHFDSDHINGLSELLRRTNVARIALSNREDGAGARDQVLLLARETGCEVLTVCSKTDVTFGAAELTVYPPAGETENDGLSVRCSLDAFDILVTGDMDTQDEAALVSREQLAAVEVLVAGHHGSATSTGDALLSAITPKAAVISVGYNSYGHPAADTLARLRARDISVFRTDLNGTVTIQY